MKIAVTSKSFSKNKLLREQLLSRYPNTHFNDQEITFNDSTLIHFLNGCDRAIVGLEKINDEILAQLPHLKVISKYGVGCDNIDFDSLKKRKILFGYTAGVNKRGVSELTLQMMLILVRKAMTANLDLRAGKWIPQFGNNLSNKTIGILGLGNVGKDLVSLLAPFNCQILANDLAPDLKFCNQFGVTPVDIESLFSNSDLVSIHVPLDLSTRGFVGEKLMSRMKSQGILINTARGGIVDEACLYKFLSEGKIAAAGFDVFSEEPLKNSSLVGLNNFFATPHIGGSSVESVIAMGQAAIAGLDTATEVI